MRTSRSSVTVALAAALFTLASLVTGLTTTAAALGSPPSTFTAVQPTRFLDTVRGVGIPVGAVGAKTTVTGSAAALAPANTTAVVLNLWAESPAADTAITVFPHGQARPTWANLLVQAGSDAPTRSPCRSSRTARWTSTTRPAPPTSSSEHRRLLLDRSRLAVRPRRRRHRPRLGHQLDR